MDQLITWRAHTNIALIKYWGKRNHDLFLPMTGSLSLTLDGFYTETEVAFLNPDQAQADQFILNGQLQDRQATQSVSRFINLFRQQAGQHQPVWVNSHNYVPTAAGLASSASAYAALACSLNDLFKLDLSPRMLSTYARQGSGSACRSLFGGFVEWYPGQGNDSDSSYSEMIDPGQWDIGMLTVILQTNQKKISSRQGMEHTILTSPFYQLWPQEVAHDLDLIRPAIQAHDFDTVGRVAEHNAMKMHATILAANPSLSYWVPESVRTMQIVRQLRDEGVPCYFTMDAGPNVKILCRSSELARIEAALLQHYQPEQLVYSQAGPAPYRLG